MTNHPADFTLERYRLRELPASEHAAIDRLRAADHRIDHRLALLDLSDAEITTSYPARDLVRDVTRRQRSATLRLTTTDWAIAAVLVAAVSVFVWQPAIPDRLPGERGKGSGAGLTVYRNTPAGGEMLADNSVVRPGDVIRVGYRTSERAYGTIISIDGRGVVSQHLPAEGTRSVSLEPKGDGLAPDAFELDDAPAIERFFLVTSAAPFDIQAVVDAVRQSGGAPERLKLAPSFQVVTLSLRKESRP